MEFFVFCVAVGQKQQILSYATLRYWFL